MLKSNWRGAAEVEAEGGCWVFSKEVEEFMAIVDREGSADVRFLWETQQMRLVSTIGVSDLRIPF